MKNIVHKKNTQRGFTPSNSKATYAKRKYVTGFTRHNAGFTLVEMLISVGVFSIVMIITVGALLVVVDSFQKTRLLRNTMENVSITIESMTKKIRTGRDYDCTPATSGNSNADCPPPNGSNTLSFIGADDLLYVYYLDSVNERILVCSSADKTFSSPCRNVSSTNPAFVAATSPEIKVVNLTFYVTGVNSDVVQDRVTITASGFANLPGKADFDTEFDIQTTVSKRVLDIFN